MTKGGYYKFPVFNVNPCIIVSCLPPFAATRSSSLYSPIKAQLWMTSFIYAIDVWYFQWGQIPWGNTASYHQRVLQKWADTLLEFQVVLVIGAFGMTSKNLDQLLLGYTKWLRSLGKSYLWWDIVCTNWQREYGSCTIFSGRDRLCSVTS